MSIAEPFFDDGWNDGPPESVIAENVCKRLDRHFHVRREVPGRHWSGAKLRIDAIITPRDATGWKRPDVAFGVEFKAPGKYRSMKDMTSVVAQCADYAQTEWDGVGYVYIFLYRFHDSFDPKCIRCLTRLTSRFFVGALAPSRWRGLGLLHAGDHWVWTEQDGPVLGKTSLMLPSWGSR